MASLAARIDAMMLEEDEDDDGPPTERPAASDANLAVPEPPSLPDPEASFDVDMDLAPVPALVRPPEPRPGSEAGAMRPPYDDLAAGRPNDPSSSSAAPAGARRPVKEDTGEVTLDLDDAIEEIGDEQLPPVAAIPPRIPPARPSIPNAPPPVPPRPVVVVPPRDSAPIARVTTVKVPSVGGRPIPRSGLATPSVAIPTIAVPPPDANGGRRDDSRPVPLLRTDADGSVVADVEIVDRVGARARAHDDRADADEPRRREPSTPPPIPSAARAPELDVVLPAGWPRGDDDDDRDRPVAPVRPTPWPRGQTGSVDLEIDPDQATSGAPVGFRPTPALPTPSPDRPRVDSGESPALDAGGVEVGTSTPNIVVDQPLEAHLETPTVVDRALEELGDAGGELRAEAMAKELEATPDAAVAAYLAYELGELCERRLDDEARAVKAFGRALSLDPSLRPNLWAIRRVFYRRGLWPNLVKLIAAEVAYARDDHERADLLLEKAWVAGHKLDDVGEARAALDEAVRIAPQHQGALLELERIVTRANDVPAMLDVWEWLAEAVEQPARRIGYWLDVGRAAASDAGGKDYPRAQAAFVEAQKLADQLPGSNIAERVARERLRIAQVHGAPDEEAAAIDGVATALLAGIGTLAGEGLTEGETARARGIRRELVALRRRQAQLVRATTPERAWDVLQQALALSPGEPVILNDLTELAEELGRYDDLAELVQSWQAVEGDPGRAMVLSIRRADALLRGGQRDQARALLASLEATAPGFIVLTSAAERDALARNDAAALARTYLAAAHAALLGTWLGPGQPPAPDPAAAAALYVQAAELFAYEVGRDEPLDLLPADEARTALGKALEAVPGYPPALEALTELDDATGNVAAALARLKTAAIAADGDARRAIYERAIRVARAHGDLESVYELEHTVAQLAPGDLDLKWRLEATLAQLNRDKERAELLGELAAAETDATRRGTALLAAARLRERTDNVEAATDLYRQVLVLWPEDTFARESLVDLLRAQERWTELVAERRAEARLLPDGPAARRALREAAWVLEVRLGDTASAATVYDDWLVRLPDDRAALEGVARCRAAFGDRNGEVNARRQIADLDPSPEAQWLLGRALERSGQFDEAADVFRGLSVREDPSVAANSAAFALADLAAGRADTVMRLEATAALAHRTTEPRLGAALAEDSGWMYALVLEDFERAAQSFEAAIALDPGRRGALLGAALVAARRLDPLQLSAAYEGLAASITMPEAAAALYLRAAAMAAAQGDIDAANARVTAARASAPDDASALLVVAETSAMPTVESSQLASDSSRRDAVDALLARGEVLEMRAALADDPTARASWELDRAEALELAGRLREAGTVVAAVLGTTPGDLRALEAMRRLARRAGDMEVWAHASFQLARVLGDPAGKLELLRDAATVLDRNTNDPKHAQEALAIYRRILQVDPGASELDRLLELYRQQADVRGLVTALTDRLAWLESREEDLATQKQMVPLLLERATVLLGLGDTLSAMADLDALLDRAASHVEALRFRADLAFNAGDLALAVDLWNRTLAVETRPDRRQDIEQRLAAVYEESGNVAGAIENLERVVEANPDDVQLRERLLGLCLRAGEWDRATRELRVLARLRPTPQEKAREELRLGLMLRDRLNDKSGARLALDRARNMDPLNLDVVRELAELLEPAARAQVLAATASSFRASIAQNPRGPILFDRLAQVTGWQSDVDARWLALVGLEALGTPSVDQRQVLEQGRGKLGLAQKLKLDDATRQAIRGNAFGALVDLWRAIAPAVQIATGVDVAKLGFARGDKIALKKLGEKYDPLAGALYCFGLEDVEVYVSAQRAGVTRVLAGDTHTLCVGGDVAAAHMPHQRWLLGRIVAMLAEGLASLQDLRDQEVGWTIVAALRGCDAPVPPQLAAETAGDEAAIVERAKVIKSKISRKAKATVVQLAQQRPNELVDVHGFRRAAFGVGHRAGLLWAGDLAVALAQLDVGRGGKALTDSPPALELTGWSVSEEHQRLREKLGIALKLAPRTT